MLAAERESATSASTADALIVVEGLHESAAADIASAVTDLTALLGSYQPQARLSTRALSPA